MKNTSELAQLFIGIGAIAAFLLKGLPLGLAIIVLVSGLLLMLHYFLPWDHKQWIDNTRETTALSFKKIIISLHIGVRSLLFASVLLCGLGGVLIKHGPTWMTIEVKNTLETIDLDPNSSTLTRALPESWTTRRDKGLLSNGYVYATFVNDNIITMSSMSQTIVKVLEDIHETIEGLGGAMLVIASLVGLMLFPFENIGTVTHKLDAQHANGDK